jgi:hypothetical protein
MKSILVGLTALSTLACAQKTYLDRDKDNPNYYEGQGVPVTDNLSAGGIYHSFNITPQSGSATDAVVGLIESGVSLALNPGYYQPSTIGGTCIIGESTLSQVPCRHTLIELLDDSGKPVSTTSCNGSGQFAFYVKKDKSYGLRPADPRYSIASTDIPNGLKMGETVILHVK